jgi:hypothetical protein
MTLCQEFGRWVDDTVLQSVERFFSRMRQSCTEARTWVEREIRTPLESVQVQWEQQCREQNCNWFCLCCNKWVCSLVSVLLKVIVWIVTVVGEWLVEVICRLITEILRLVVLTLINVLRWIVELVVCLVERFCQILFVLAALALLAAFVGLIAALIPALAALGLPAVATALGIGVALLLLARTLCEASRCRVPGVVVWALKWATVIGAGIAVVFLSANAAFVAVLYGGFSSALTWMLIRQGCPVPRLLGPP